MKLNNDVRPPITLLIAVAVRLYRDGLTAALSAHEHLRVEATAGTALEAQAAVRHFQPDVVIIDVSLDDVRGLMGAVRTECSRSRILAFAVREEISTILDYAEAGADGFVTANGTVVELVESIERTAAGELLCSPRMAAQLLRRAAHQPAGAPEHAVSPILTHREQQVFALLKQGRSNKEIAIALHIAEATVKNHVHQVLQKLHVGTRGQAVAAGAPALKVRLGHSTARSA